mmetsp:Transcript_15436/g.44317  ORF Transcript_15436/g.44317 Transcript_15436/m.44317 type:complete len:90 (-) Transcript_15436:22-291(-)
MWTLLIVNVIMIVVGRWRLSMLLLWLLPLTVVVYAVAAASTDRSQRCEEMPLTPPPPPPPCAVMHRPITASRPSCSARPLRAHRARARR